MVQKVIDIKTDRSKPTAVLGCCLGDDPGSINADRYHRTFVHDGWLLERRLMLVHGTQVEVCSMCLVNV